MEDSRTIDTSIEVYEVAAAISLSAKMSKFLVLLSTCFRPVDVLGVEVADHVVDHGQYPIASSYFETVADGIEIVIRYSTLEWFQ